MTMEIASRKGDDPALIQALTELTALRDRARVLTDENVDLKCSVIAFGSVWAAKYASDWDMLPTHIDATHYDILERAGARMDDFVRSEDRTALAEKDKNDA